MKNFRKNTLLLLTIVISINISSQDTYSKIIYKKRSNIDLGKTKSKNKEAIKLLETVFDRMDRLEYVLLFNKKKSIFREVLKLNTDFEESSLATKLSKLMGESEGVYFTDTKINKIYHQNEFESELFLIEYNIKNDWELTQETKKIGEYLCYKAIKNDNYLGSSGNLIDKQIIAWYTPQIPLPFGPLKYNGLPGLIIELINNKTVFYTKEIQLNFNDKVVISKPKKGVKVTQRKYDSIVMGLTKDFRKNNRN